jgi:ankyrin repeat protein
MQTYNADVAGALLEAGADPYLRDTDGKTALDHARDFNDPALNAVLGRWMEDHPK